MNQKGLYGALIGLMAVMLVTSFIYQSQGMQQTDKASIERENILEVNKQWQRASFLMDKAAADAIGDAIYSNGCAMPGQMAIDVNVQAYFNSVLSQTELSCKYSLGTPFISIDGFDVNAVIDMNCYQITNELVAWMQTETRFEKRVSDITFTPGAPNTCHVQILDLQAEETGVGAIELDLTTDMSSP